MVYCQGHAYMRALSPTYSIDVQAKKHCVFLLASGTAKSSHNKGGPVEDEAKETGLGG